MSIEHEIIVVGSKHDGDNWETINLLCETCSRLIYASGAVDPELAELTKAGARHRRNPEWIEQSAALVFLKGN